MGLRAVIHGDLDGYPVQVQVYTEDLEARTEEGDFEFLREVEPGVFQAITTEMQRHNIRPPFAKKAAPTTSSNSTSWACPTHGAKNVRDAKFGSGVECGEYEETSNKPDWAKNKPFVVKGKNRWYCKYREIEEDRS